MPTAAAVAAAAATAKIQAMEAVTNTAAALGLTKEDPTSVPPNVVLPNSMTAGFVLAPPPTVAPAGPTPLMSVNLSFSTSPKVVCVEHIRYIFGGYLLAVASCLAGVYGTWPCGRTTSGSGKRVQSSDSSSASKWNSTTGDRRSNDWTWRFFRSCSSHHGNFNTWAPQYSPTAGVIC